MTDEQIEEYQKWLIELKAKCSDKQPERTLKNELKQLANEVGASTYVIWVHPTSSGLRTSDADTPELIRNIHQALQTASMVNMCKTAKEGYEMATKATRNARIQFCIATVISFICAVAAWIAAIRN